MSATNCRQWATELVEYARADVAPRRELREHLRVCAACEARWNSERNLSAHLHAAREAAAVCQPADAARERIMQQFARMHRHTVHPVLRWALAAAAAFVLIVAVGSVWRGGGWDVLQFARPTDSSTGISAGTETVEAEAPEAGEDFVAVPYAPPLAPGEFVRVVHTELGPVELARMGVLVNVMDAGEIPADVVVGEDGFPRAVRVGDESQF